jgi:hypothetical protein
VAAPARVLCAPAGQVAGACASMIVRRSVLTPVSNDVLDEGPWGSDPRPAKRSKDQIGASRDRDRSVPPLRTGAESYHPLELVDGVADAARSAEAARIVVGDARVFGKLVRAATRIAPPPPPRVLGQGARRFEGSPTLPMVPAGKADRALHRRPRRARPPSRSAAAARRPEDGYPSLAMA